MHCLASWLTLLFFSLSGFGFFGRRSMRVWELVQPGVRNQHGGAEHRTVQQWLELRSLFRDAMRQWPQVVPLRHHHRHRHQLLPPQLRFGQQQRRLVQSSPPTLRPRRACLPPNCTVPRRHRPRCLPKVRLLKRICFSFPTPSLHTTLVFQHSWNCCFIYIYIFTYILATNFMLHTKIFSNLELKVVGFGSSDRGSPLD